MLRNIGWAREQPGSPTRSKLLVLAIVKGSDQTAFADLPAFRCRRLVPADLARDVGLVLLTGAVQTNLG